MVDLLREEATSLIADLGRALEGRYVIGDALGSGRGGITVRAERVASGRTVALKVAWNDPVARERVWREMVLTSEAKHLNVLPMRPVEAPDSMVVVEMPLASGGTVDDLLNTRTPVPYARTLDIVRAVASALEQAHSKGIVHGALAPEKILFDDAGHVWITDFALHVPPVPGWNVPRHSAIADPPYSAIELRHESPKTNARADQFSLAIIAYELLRGQRTWHVNEEGVLEIDPIEINVTRPIAPGTPLGTGLAIRRATSRDPGYRYENVTSFVHAFAGEVVDPVALPHAYADHVTAPRHHSKAWILAPLVVLLVALVVAQPSTRDLFVSWWYGNGSDPGPAPTASAQSSSASASVSVTIDGNRRALVFIDGFPRGMTPLVWEGKAGRHTVRLVGPGSYSPSALTVDARAGDTVNAPFGVPRR
jgi:serine/threonine protein kinase